MIVEIEFLKVVLNTGKDSVKVLDIPQWHVEEAEKVLETAQQAERNQEVVDPQLIEVTIEGGVPVPVKRREAIRAKGPTIRPDLGKQAEG